MSLHPGPQNAVTPPPRLIETLRVEPGGTLPLLEGHLTRLQASCAALGYPAPDIAALREQLTQRAAQLDTARAWRLRLLAGHDGSHTLEHSPLATPGDPLPVVLRGPRDGGAAFWLRHKTTHRPWYEDAARWLAGHPTVFDILYWNEDGMMCEGSRSNLYMLASDNRWLTPPLSSGALPGVQRQALLQAGLAHEAPISRDAFLQARAWRISNALRGWRDVIPAAG